MLHKLKLRAALNGPSHLCTCQAAEQWKGFCHGHVDVFRPRLFSDSARNVVGGAIQPVCITDGILSCRRVQDGSLIKHVKFDADWSIYNKVIAASSVMTKHEMSTV